MTTHYDLIVIGSGTAGTTGAHACAKEGWRVAVVDNLPFGGTCVLRGCDPKKILRRGAEIIDSASLLTGKGIDPGTLRVDWPALMAHKRGFTEPMSDKIEKGLESAGVKTLHGRASFTAPDRLTVDGNTLTASHFLIATGARPKAMPFEGNEHMIDSTAFMELEELPNRILFVGGGFISFEFAHIAARVGSDVTIATHGPRLLKGFDPDLVDLLRTRSTDLGIDIRTGIAINSIVPTGSGFAVVTEMDGKESTLEVDLVVHGAGREPDLADLNLEAASVEYSKAGVTVSEHLQSVSNSAIYAAGDAAASPGMPLTPVASMEGGVAARNMLNETRETPDYAGIPTAVFTIPELVRVGMLEDEAREQGLDTDVRYSDTSEWFSNYRLGETVAATKIIIDRETRRILGAHMLGPEYAEVVNIIALAMRLGLTADEVSNLVAAYPSVGSDLGSML